MMTAPLDALSGLAVRSPVLTAAALAHGVLLGVTLVLGRLDRRRLLGVSVWSKPSKFMASIAVYLGTVAWLVGHLPESGPLVSVVTWGIALSMVAETACLLVQAGRGTRSHYNVTTAFDRAVFGTMAAMIFLDTALMVVLLGLFLAPVPALAPPLLLGIRAGLVLFLVGGAVGGRMIANGAHTVGAPDGGPGLALLGWSTRAGDLRIAHALGLHGLQVLPLLGLVVSRWDAGPRGTALVWVAALVWLALTLAFFAQARAGRPLLRA